MGSAALIAVAAQSLVGCGVIRNMDEMHDATVSMNNKMDGTNSAVARTNDAVERTNLYVETTYFDLRQGNAKTIRYNALEEMERSISPEAKIAAAGVFAMGFEFQLWTGTGPDTASRRDGLYDEAMKELFRTIQNYKELDRPIDVASTDGQMLNLEAIAVTLHFVNPSAIPDPRTRRDASLLSLIEDTIARREALWSLSTAERARIPDYQKEILDHLEDAVYLLQLRANFLAAMVLGKVSDIQSAGLIAKAGMLFKGWDARLDRLNVTQLDSCKLWLDESMRVRGELSSWGFDPRMYSKLMKIYRNMRTAAISEAVEAEGAKASSLNSGVEANQARASVALAEGIERFRKY